MSSFPDLYSIADIQNVVKDTKMSIFAQKKSPLAGKLCIRVCRGDILQSTHNHFYAQVVGHQYHM